MLADMRLQPVGMIACCCQAVMRGALYYVSPKKSAMQAISKLRGWLTQGRLTVLSVCAMSVDTPLQQGLGACKQQ